MNARHCLTCCVSCHNVPIWCVWALLFVHRRYHGLEVHQSLARLHYSGGFGLFCANKFGNLVEFVAALSARADLPDSIAWRFCVFEGIPLHRCWPAVRKIFFGLDQIGLAIASLVDCWISAAVVWIWNRWRRPPFCPARCVCVCVCELMSVRRAPWYGYFICATEVIQCNSFPINAIIIFDNYWWANNLHNWW